MRLGIVSWLPAPGHCCHRHRDILSSNKHKTQSFGSNPPKIKVEWGVREKLSGSQKPCEPEICVQTLLLPQTHQNFPQDTVFSYYRGKGESFPHSSLPVEKHLPVERNPSSRKVSSPSKKGFSAPRTFFQPLIIWRQLRNVSAVCPMRAGMNYKILLLKACKMS